MKTSKNPVWPISLKFEPLTACGGSDAYSASPVRCCISCSRDTVADHGYCSSCVQGGSNLRETKDRAALPPHVDREPFDGFEVFRDASVC